MITYICCKRGGNNCPKRDECRRYANADIGEARGTKLMIKLAHEYDLETDVYYSLGQ